MNVLLPSSPPAPTSEELAEKQKVIAEMHDRLQADLRKIADASGREAVLDAKARAVSDAERLLSYREEIINQREAAVAALAAQNHALAESLQRRATEFAETVRESAARVAAQSKE